MEMLLKAKIFLKWIEIIKIVKEEVPDSVTFFGCEDLRNP
jgi:hypothetical protein